MATPRRDLSLDHYPTPFFPKNHLHWSNDELAEWSQVLSAAGKLTPAFERRMEQLQRHRNDTSLEGAVCYHTRELPPADVLADVPMTWLAYRANPNCPALALLGHRMAILAGQIAGETRKGSKAARERLNSLSRRLHGRRRVRNVFINGFAMQGGLRLRFHDDCISVHLDNSSQPFVSGPACDAQLPRIRALVSAWNRYVRLSVAASLRHAAPRFLRTVASSLDFVLPRHQRNDVDNALCLEGGALRVGNRVLLPATGHYEEAEVRHAVAGAMLDRITAGIDVTEEIDLALASAARRTDGSFVGRLDVAKPSRDQVLSHLDETGRTMIRAYRAGDRVSIEEPADAYEIWQDSITGPHAWLTVTSLALAVDLEASNRVTPAFRMGLCINGNRIGYAATPV